MQAVGDRTDVPGGLRGSHIVPLTALRGLAAWWVVLFHFDSYLQPYIPSWAFYLVSKGYLAVDLFFCLSGFVIFLNYGRLNLTAPREIGIFYLKRFAKIYPLHLLTICLYVFLVGLLLLTHRDVANERFSGASLLLNLLLIQDWAIFRDLTWNVPSWSISAEFASYLLFPVVVLMVRGVGGRLVAGVAAILMFLCFLNIFYLPDFHLGKAIPTLGVIRCLAQFSIGAILASFYQSRPVPHRFLRPCLLVLAAMLFAVGMERYESVMIPAAWTLLVFAVSYVRSGWLSYRWLVFIGEISYSTYMIHYFVRDIFKLGLVRAGETTPISSVVIALSCVFISSIPLYYLVERPAQKRLTTWAKRTETGQRATGQVA